MRCKAPGINLLNSWHCKMAMFVRHFVKILQLLAWFNMLRKMIWVWILSETRKKFRNLNNFSAVDVDNNREITPMDEGILFSAQDCSVSHAKDTLCSLVCLLCHSPSSDWKAVFCNKEPEHCGYRCIWNCSLTFLWKLFICAPFWVHAVC